MMSDKLKNSLEEKIAEYNSFAEAEAFNNMKFDDERSNREVAKQKDIGETMNAAIKALLNEDVPSLEFNDEFYKIARECLTMKPYVLYDGLKLAEGVTEEKLKPFSEQISLGNLAALGDLVKKEVFYISTNYAVYVNFRGLICNLRFLSLTLAHRAKHFNSFAAGEKFLRAASILNRFDRRSTQIDEESVDQVLEYLEDGLEDLAIAADYHKMPNWEEYVKDAKSRILG